jgi:hypothetical protein
VTFRSPCGHFLRLNPETEELEVSPQAEGSTWDRRVHIHMAVGEMHSFANAKGYWLCAYRGIATASRTYGTTDQTRKWSVVGCDGKWTHMQAKLLAELELAASSDRLVESLREEMTICQESREVLERLIKNE